MTRRMKSAILRLAFCALRRSRSESLARSFRSIGPSPSHSKRVSVTMRMVRQPKYAPSSLRIGRTPTKRGGLSAPLVSHTLAVRQQRSPSVAEACSRRNRSKADVEAKVMVFSVPSYCVSAVLHLATVFSASHPKTLPSISRTRAWEVAVSPQCPGRMRGQSPGTARARRRPDSKGHECRRRQLRIRIPSVAP